MQSDAMHCPQEKRSLIRRDEVRSTRGIKVNKGLDSAEVSRRHLVADSDLSQAAECRQHFLVLAG